MFHRCSFQIKSSPKMKWIKLAMPPLWALKSLRWKIIWSVAKDKMPQNVSSKKKLISKRKKKKFKFWTNKSKMAIWIMRWKLNSLKPCKRKIYNWTKKCKTLVLKSAIWWLIGLSKLSYNVRKISLMKHCTWRKIYWNNPNSTWKWQQPWKIYKWRPMKLSTNEESSKKQLPPWKHWNQSWTI